MFKVGDLVTHKDGRTGVVSCIEPECKYPLIVDWGNDTIHHSYTLDGKHIATDIYASIFPRNVEEQLPVANDLVSLAKELEKLEQQVREVKGKIREIVK